MSHTTRSSWYATPAPAYGARSAIHVNLSESNGVPPPAYELRGLVSDDEYSHRLNAAAGLLRRYSWSVVERVFLVFAVVVSLAAPLVVAQVLQHVLVEAAQVANATADDRTFVEAERKAYFDARMIGFGVAVGVAALLWIPYVVFKAIGNRRIANLLNTFTANDANRGTQMSLQWKLASTSAFTQTATVSITLPSSSVTNFHQQAYLPTYISKAEEQGSYTQFPAPNGSPPKAVPFVADVGQT